MSYFDQSFLKFMRGLARNNNRDWFNAHKKEYEKQVKEPFAEFVEELIHRLQAEDRAIVVEPKNAIFRIFRDIRFSKDKTPYKTYVSAVITRGGRKDMQYPGIYVQLGGKEMGIAGGAYAPDKPNLELIRRAIQADPKRFQKIVNGRKFKSVCGELKGAKNKVLPGDFKEDAAEIPWLAFKQFHYWAEYDADEVLREDLPEFVLNHYAAARPLTDFLKEALEPNL